jgi:enoyl-CoA hydratase/carnithine racemase
MTSEESRQAVMGRRDFIGAGTAAVTLLGSSLAAEGQPGPQARGSPSSESGTTPGRETVKIERLGGVLLIGIDRAEAQNRIDFPTYVALGHAYYEFERDDTLRVAVLHGVGPDFSRGIDPQSWAKALSSRQPQASDFIDPLAVSGAERSKPLLVAVQGQVVRIAHELFLAADVRIAASNTVFNQGEVFGGAFPGGGGTVRFVREAGWANAMRYMLSGEDWSAEEARRLGLVQEVTAPDKQLDRAVALAKRIATAAPLGVRATLASAHRSLADGEKAAFAALQPEFVRLLRSEDRQEFIRSLQDNRAPVFVGR